MNAALRLVAHTIRPIADSPDETRFDADVLTEASEIARANKVLLAFYEGLARRNIEFPEHLDRVLQSDLERESAYGTMLEEIAQRANRAGIEFTVVKSKPFPYVGDDIDFLLRDRESFVKFSTLLEESGFSEIGQGPVAATFGKEVGKMQLMADVHAHLSASYMPYVDGSGVWARRVCREVYGTDVSTPCIEDEIRILAGHSLQKEFRLNLAEFFATWHYLDRSDRQRLFKYASWERTGSILSIFLISINEVSRRLYGAPLIDHEERKLRLLERLANRTVSRDWSTQSSMPYRYHTTLPLIAFFERFVDEVAAGGRATVDFLGNALRMPFTNREGLRILLDYFRARLH